VDSNNSDTLEFPPIPGYRVEWFPIRFEPIQNGGERLTAAIAVIGQDGAVKVVPSFENRQLQCVFGEASRGIIDLVRAASVSLETHLKNGSSAGEWKAPSSGFYADTIRTTYVHSLDEAIVLGAMETACLAANNRTILEMDSPDVTEEEESWARQIRDAALHQAPHLKDAFGKTFRVRNLTRRTRIDFIGSHLAANFGKVVPHNIGYYVDRSRIKLWNLRIMRDHFGALGPQRIELLLNIPQVAESPGQEEMLKEAIGQIEAEADLEDIRLRTFTEAEGAAGHIVQAERAA